MSEQTAFAFQLGAIILFVALMVCAAIGDVRRFRIPNSLNAAIAASFFFLAIPLGLTWSQIGLHAIWFASVSAVCLGAFYFGVFGGGDAKMIGAVTAWMGPAGLAPFLVIMTLAGGILALALLTGRLIAKRTGLPKGPRWLRQILRRKAGVPYGVAIGVGALFALPTLPWVTLI